MRRLDACAGVADRPGIINDQHAAAVGDLKHPETMSIIDPMEVHRFRLTEGTRCGGCREGRGSHAYTEQSWKPGVENLRLL